MYFNHERKCDQDNQQDVTLPVMTVTNPRTSCQVRSSIESHFDWIFVFHMSTKSRKKCDFINGFKYFLTVNEITLVLYNAPDSVAKSTIIQHLVLVLNRMVF